MKDVNLLVNNGVNVNKALELFGDMATYDDTLVTFLNDAENKLKQIDDYKEKADMANYAILVHSLKSDAKYFGFDKLAELAYDHEMKSKANDFYYVSDHFDELMTEAKRIVNLVRKYLGKESVELLDDDDNGSGTGSKNQTILVVDDSAIIVNFVKKIFDNQYNVLIANDGAQALNIVKNTPSSQMACMLLDLNMPNVNGFEVLDYFKNNDLFKKVPVSIITGEGSKDIIEKAFTYPIVDVLMKPFNELNVESIVNKTISFKSE